MVNFMVVITGECCVDFSTGKITVDFVIELFVLLVCEKVNGGVGISWGGLYRVGGGLVG